MTEEWHKLFITPANALEKSYVFEVFKLSNVAKIENGELWYNAAAGQEINELVWRRRQASTSRKTLTLKQVRASLVKREINPVDMAIAMAVEWRRIGQPTPYLSVWQLLSGIGREPFMFTPAPQLYLIPSLDGIIGSATRFFRRIYDNYLEGERVTKYENGNVWIALDIDGEYELSALKLEPVKKTQTFNYQSYNINYGVVAAYSVWHVISPFPVSERRKTLKGVLKNMGEKEREVFDDFYGFPGLVDEMELFLYLGEE